MPPSADDTDRAKQHFFAGLAAYEARDYVTAETQFKAALAIVPGRVSALVNLAVVLFRQEKLSESRCGRAIGSRKRSDRRRGARMAFLHARPISTTNPIWVKILLSEPRM